MFGTFFSALKGQNTNEQAITRRRFSRRNCDKCVTVIADKTYPVENWSLGGVLIYGDSRPFGVHDEVDVMMKFKLRNEVMDVSHKAKVIRKTNEKVAFEFMPLTRQIRNSFQSVVDDYVAGQFADSQLT